MTFFFICLGFVIVCVCLCVVCARLFVFVCCGLLWFAFVCCCFLCGPFGLRSVVCVLFVLCITRIRHGLS